MKQPIPPGPKARLLVGNLFEYLSDPPGFLSQIAREYGDIVQFRLGRKKVYLLNHPDYIKDVLVTKRRSFVKSGVLQRARRLVGSGLVTSEGDLHLRQRRLVQPIFNRSRLASYSSIMVDYAQRTRDRWHDGECVMIREEMQQLTLGIIGRTLFGMDVAVDASEVGHALTATFEHFNRLVLPFSGILERLPLASTRRFQQAKRFLDSTVYRLIAQRRASDHGSDDILSHLLRARDIEGDGKGMSDNQVRDEVMTLYLAGHETLSLTLTWTWYLLAHHPIVEQEFHKEIDSVLGGRMPTGDDYERLPLTRMIVAESMRLFPPAWMLPRRANEDVPMGPYVIPNGSTVGISQYVMHRDPRFYVDPEQFIPQRWRAEEVAKRPKYSYFPFGGGVRVCVGEPFAWMEAVLLLAVLGQKWSLSLKSREPVRIHATLTLQPKDAMEMIAHERRSLVRTGGGRDSLADSGHDNA